MKAVVYKGKKQGVVEEVGDGVTSIQPGDRVVLPFNIALHAQAA